MDDADRAQDVIEQQLSVNLSQRKNRINSSLPSAEQCETCDEDIPKVRQTTLPGVRLCVGCASLKEIQAQQYR